MIAHFYLMAESFAYNKNLTNENIEAKIKRLSEDVVLIHQHKDTNKIFTNYEDIYPKVFYETYTVEDFLCKPLELKDNGVDRDVVNSLQKILDRSSETTISSSEVISELLEWNDEDNCHGIIAFHPIEKLDSHLQIIYGVDGWYKFRRYYLSLYPKNKVFFIDECCKYFPNLHFHEDNKSSISTILHNCPKKIIYHLSALNDKFNNIDIKNLNRSQILEKFSIEAELDATATLEGDATRRKDLTFNFIDKNNKEIPVYCEPHLKLCYNDYYPGDSSYSNGRRIYFHEGIPTIADSKILIGHIGNHL